MCSYRYIGSASSASRVLVTPPLSGQAMKHAYSLAASSFGFEAVSTLDPFAMYTAFSCSDYYGSSAPFRRHQPATGLPHHVGRDRRSGSHVHSRTLQRGRCPAMPLQPRHGYAAVLHRGLPAGDIDRPRSSPNWPDPSGVCCNPALICQVRVGGPCLRGFPPLVPRVHLSVSLAGPTPSDSAGASRRCQGCFHLHRCPSGQAALSFIQPAATGCRRWSLTTARFENASWRSMSATQIRSRASVRNWRSTRSGAAPWLRSTRVVRVPRRHA